MRTRLLLPAAAIVLAAGCSSGPQPPQPGTPAFLWNAAKATWKAGDFVKTGENLQQLIKTDNEFAAKARPWSIIVAAGLAQGYSADADAFETGAKANRQNPMPFRKEASQLRSLASAATLEFTEELHNFMLKPPEELVVLAFDFPTGAAAEPPNIRKVTSGALIQESERESLLAAMLQRGVVLSASRAAGAAEDTPKAMEVFKTPDLHRPRTDFLFGLAKELYDRSDLYTPTKLDHPGRFRLVLEQAQEALKAVPESKDTKALNTKIQAALKKITGKT